MKHYTKKWNFSILAASLLIMLVAFTSCSSDDNDDGGSNQPVTQYESVAGKYTLTSSSSPYRSIEFTESGNYIIESSGGTRATSETTILTGTYTYDNESQTYVLDNQYTVKVAADTNGVNCNIIITQPGGQSVTYTGEKEASHNSDNANSSSICRTWTVISAHETIKHQGRTVFEWSGSPSQVNDYLVKKNTFNESSDYGDGVTDLLTDYDTGGVLKQVIFTKSGTYAAIWSSQYGESDYIGEIMYWKWIDGSTIATTEYSPEQYDIWKYQRRRSMVQG